MINAKFFRSEAQDALSANTMSVEKKTSPQQMIDVFMTPTQSDEEFSEESISPTDETADLTAKEVISSFTINEEEKVK